MEDEKTEMEFFDCEENFELEKDMEISEEDDEPSKIKLMRALVEREYPSAKGVADDLMIRRFLRARNLDIEKASRMLLKYFSWRGTFVPNGFVSESEIPNQISHNKFFVQGFDKQGQPVVVAFANRHKPGGKESLEEFKRFSVYCLDKVCARMPRGQEKFLAIVDLNGWGYTNSDIRGYIACLSILQDCFPERLGKLYMVHVPYIFTTVWKVIYPFIDSRTKNKIVFVEKNKLKSTLLSDIGESQLPDIYGGKLSLVPIQTCC